MSGGAMRGRSPRPRSYSPNIDGRPARHISRSESSDSSWDENYETGREDDLNTMLFPFTKSDAVLFLKCLTFSVFATISILSYTNGDDVTCLVSQYKHDTYIKGMQVLKSVKLIFDVIHIEGTTVVQTSDLERKEITNDNTSIDVNNIVYNIEVPPECRLSNEQCPDNVLTPEIIEAFQKDGVVAIRGLLTNSELKGLRESSDDIIQDERRRKRGSRTTGRQFYSSKNHVIFDDKYDEGLFGVEDDNGFRRVALFSILPYISQTLLRYDAHRASNAFEENKSEQVDKSLRVIRDVFLAKDQDPFHCGWHVDDTGFWPSTSSSPGINAWIAIDDMPKSTGGGFALSIGSHLAEWKEEVYNITGSTFTLPDEGYRDAEDMFQRRGVGTCNIKNAASHLHEKLEDVKRVYDLRAGDVILHTRWLFHRTVPFEYDFIQKQKSLRNKIDKLSEDSLLYRRYSIRYSPGNAILPKGYGTELSLLHNPELEGKTLDEVTGIDGPWYPQCWPAIDQNELSGMKNIFQNKMVIAEETRKHRMKEMAPFLQEMGRQKRKSQLDNVHQGKKYENQGKSSASFGNKLKKKQDGGGEF